MQTSTIIEAAGAAERDWCARLMASSDPWITLGRGLADCRARCEAPGYELFVAFRDGAPRGFVLLHPRGLAGSPYIAAIATYPRGEGAGKLLLDFAERHYPAARHIFLCVSSFNTLARKLYEREGYEVVGELKDYVIEGASELIMHKRLVRP